MTYPSIDKTNFTNKTVLVRVDFNVPLSVDGKITNDARIQAHASTIRTLVKAGAKVVLMSHLGSPNGRKKLELSLKVVADRLASHIKQPVLFAEDCIGDKAISVISQMKSGEVCLLENLRFHSGEELNDTGFAQQLASLADAYVNDAFATAHRKHASNNAIVQYLPSFIGHVMKAEVDALDAVFNNSKPPVLLIMGGAKMSTKLKILNNLVPKVNQIMIGGAMANTFLVALGKKVGDSLYEPDMVETARNILSEAGTIGVRVLLPQDVVTARTIAEDDTPETHDVGNIPYNHMVLDIGPQTMRNWKKAIQKAGTILWNGPMGVFETKPYHEGTLEIARDVAKASAFSVVGGGDTLSAINTIDDDISAINLISTGGGALLQYLEGNTLPALQAFEEKEKAA